MSFFNTFTTKNIDNNSPTIAKKYEESVFLMLEKLESTNSLHKIKDLSHFFYKHKLKTKSQKLKQLSQALIKLNLNSKRFIFIRLIFIRIKNIIFQKNTPDIYFFLNQLSKRALWKNLTSKDQKSINSGIDLKLNKEKLNKINKVISDISTGDNPLENQIEFSLCKLLISQKYGLKILKLVFAYKKMQILSFAMEKLSEEKNLSENPKILNVFRQKKLKEKKELDSFLKDGLSEVLVDHHPKEEKITFLHRSEMKRIEEKLHDDFRSKPYSLRRKEKMILSNWAGQQLNRIMRYYRREYLTYGYSKLLRNHHIKQYQNKVLLNLYEKYRCYRIKDLLISFLVWKSKCLRLEKLIKINTLMFGLEKYKFKKLRQYFLDFIYAVFEKDSGSSGKSSGKIKGAIILQRIFEKKKVLLMEKIFTRIKHEKYLIDIANKINSIDIIDRFYRKKTFYGVFQVINANRKSLKNHEKLFTILNYIMKIRKVIYFYKIYSLSRIP